MARSVKICNHNDPFSATGTPENLLPAGKHCFAVYYVTRSDTLPAFQCGCSIWLYLQSSLHCTECGYATHAHCINSSEIRRTCVANKVKTKPEFLLQICPEKPLESLKFRCVECDRKLSPDDPLLEPRSV